ncbi:MAG: DUF3298 domain-containing protein [Lachnospiraceae bacterium]|nr:DUF3298 domain-containing protein [Lachnospiraceae bacterium]
MKKKIVMGLCSIVTVVLLAGCGSDTKDEGVVFEEDVAVILRDEVPALAQTADEVSTQTAMQETEESTVVEEINAPEILITPIEEVWYTEDGTHVLLTATSSKAEVVNEGFDVLAQALNEWSDLVYNEILAEAEEYASWAAEHFALMEQAEAFQGYYTSMKLTPERIDDVIASFRALHSNYTGGAHGNYGYTGYTFDVETGELLTLDRVIADDEGFQAAAIQRILEVLEAEPYASGVFSDYEATVRGAFAQDGFLTWYLSQDGIVVTFDPYEVGPYAMGAVEIPLPYEEFKDFMAIKYRPN